MISSRPSAQKKLEKSWLLGIQLSHDSWRMLKPWLTLVVINNQDGTGVWTVHGHFRVLTRFKTISESLFLTHYILRHSILTPVAIPPCLYKKAKLVFSTPFFEKMILYGGLCNLSKIIILLSLCVDARYFQSSTTKTFNPFN